MSTVKQYFEKASKYAQANWKPILVVIGVLVVLYVVYALFFRTEGFEEMEGGYAEDNDNEKEKREDFYAGEVVIEEAGTSSDPAQKRLVLFYAPWCPHCKSMLEGDKAVWPMLGQRFRGHPVVKVEQVDCDAKPDMANKYGIKGFPTVMMFHKGKRYVYDGDRTLDSLEKFVSSSN